MEPWVRRGLKNHVENRLAGLRNLSVSWFGGEPLYGLEAIEDLAPFFVEKAEENDLRFSSNMTTNGYLLTPEVAEKLLSWEIRSYQITIDGPPEFHDCSRPARDGGGTFAVIFENLQAMKRRAEDFRIGIRINFDRKNYPHMAGFFDLLEKEFRGDSRFRLHFRAVGKWGGPKDEELDVCGHDETAQIQLEMKAEALKRGLNITDDIRQVKGLGAQVCYAARPYNFIVGASGKLMKCTIDLDKHDRNVVGRLLESGEMQLDHDKLALWTEPAFEHDSKCQKCVVLPPCQGVYCPLIRIESGKSPCSPLRMNAKKELLEILESAGAGSRRATIKGTGEATVVAPAA
jgi:uncharacterized protein